MSSFKENMTTLFSSILVKIAAGIAIVVALVLIVIGWYIDPLVGLLFLLIILLCYGMFLLLMHLMLR